MVERALVVLSIKMQTIWTAMPNQHRATQETRTRPICPASVQKTWTTRPLAPCGYEHHLTLQMGMMKYMLLNQLYIDYGFSAFVILVTKTFHLPLF